MKIAGFFFFGGGGGSKSVGHKNLFCKQNIFTCVEENWVGKSEYRRYRMRGY